MSDDLSAPQDQDMNEQLVLITGDSGAGKSASLRNLSNQENWLYLNCEVGKRLPFRNRFKQTKIEDPFWLYSAFDACQNEPSVLGVIIDTITMNMDAFEDMYIKTAEDTRAAWGEYGTYLRTLMREKIQPFGKPVLILAHRTQVYDEKKMELSYRCDIKGAVGKGKGFESMFSTVINARKVDLKELEEHPGQLLTITDEDKYLGFKHVFQVHPTKDTRTDRIRTPMGLFPRNEPFMDNDAALLLTQLNDYYGND